MISLILEANKAGARLEVAIKQVGISLRTYKRWFKNKKVSSDLRPKAVRPIPQNKLTNTEVKEILAVCNEPKYADLPPSQIVPSLLDDGIYIASESSFYRVLKAHEMLSHRGRAKPVKHKAKPTSFIANNPNEVWTWDITYLGSRVKGQYYYLYMFEDIYSRKIVGYEVHEKECGEAAAQLMQRNVMSEQCFQSNLVLHSDNGAPMKSQTMKYKLEELGVQLSYSRPRVSNDNPFSESTFKTLKYRPNWPSDGFESIELARKWVHKFVQWYNCDHKHSAINFVTPEQRHKGEDKEILAARKIVLEAKKQVNPLRWSGKTRHCEPTGAVQLNPDKKEQNEEKKVA